jgi:hypothetical protein
MTRLYLAGASAEALLCQTYMQRLRAAGIEITKDWTTPLPLPDREQSEHSRFRHAADDLHGVAEADVVWGVLPDVQTRGMWFELGVAHALGRRLLLSGDWKQSIFTALAARRYDSHEEALGYLVETYGRRAVAGPYSEMP